MTLVQRWILGCGVALVLAIGGWGLRTSLRGGHAPVVILVDPEMEAESGMGEAHRYALGTVIQDHLEVAGRVPVFRIPFAPGAESLARARSLKARVVRLRIARKGELIQWTLRWAWVEELQRTGNYREERSPLAPPREAFRWVLNSLELGVDDSASGPLLPESERGFWDFLDATALGNDAARVNEAVKRLERQAAREPRCAGVRLELGVQLYFRMNSGGATSVQDQQRARQEMQTVLAEVPYYPRGVRFLSRLQTDVGSVREALELLQDSRSHRPEDATILSSLWYPARYAGLLPLAVAANQRCQELNPMGVLPPRLSFHLLYAGHWDDFQSSLWEWPGDPRNTISRFHRAHLALIRGDRERALALFRETELMEKGSRLYRHLARCYRAILEDRREAALQDLKELQKARSGLWVPDGEITLLLAEAYALLEEPAQAMELARLAFSQGFGCTQWFESDPLLAPLRTQSQWPWLLQHLRERQALLESRFKKEGFGL